MAISAVNLQSFATLNSQSVFLDAAESVAANRGHSLKVSNDEGYTTIANANDLPKIDQYDHFSSAQEFDDIIRFNYVQDGQEKKGVVSKNQSPDLYEQVSNARDTYNAAFPSRQEGYGLVKSSSDVPQLDKYSNFGPDNEVPNSIRYDYNDNGHIEKRIVNKDITPDLYEQVSKARDTYNTVLSSRQEGYGLVKSNSDIPQFDKYSHFGPDNEVPNSIRYDYNDNGHVEKRIVNKDITPELYNKVKTDRDAFNAAQDYAHKNKLTVADSNFQVPPSVNIKSVEKVAGQDALTLTYKTHKVGKDDVPWQPPTLVTRQSVGDQKYAQLLTYAQADKWGSRIKDAGTNVEIQSAGQAFNTRNGSLFYGQEYGRTPVDGVYRGLENQGWLGIVFNGDSIFHPGKTIFINEHDSPEAFDVIRKFANTGDDSNWGTPATRQAKPHEFTATELDARYTTPSTTNSHQQWRQLEQDMLNPAANGI